MQSKISEVLSYNYVQIYLAEDELEKQETKELIEKYKRQKYKVGIFVTGKENYPEVLKKYLRNKWNYQTMYVNIDQEQYQAKGGKMTVARIL